ncbi:MAG: hypothetical protein AB1714_29780 [Acidobacteriota bacterium]
MLHKKQLSIRVPSAMRKRVRREVIRLTINPHLYLRTQHIVRWRRDAPAGRPPIELVLLARSRYPRSTLSLGVETVLVDLLLEDCARSDWLTPDERDQLERFYPLPLTEKIRVTRKRLREYRRLMSLRGCDGGGV